MFKSILGTVGNTPLIQIDLKTSGLIFAKLEYLNPSGSVKDRSALYMIEQAEKDGRLKSGGTIIEASSGNQGISIAMIGAAKKYRVIITVPSKISKEKLQTLKAYGAKVVICPETSFIEDSRSYYSQATALLKKIPGAFMPNQFFNLENTQAYYKSLGPEIWRQTRGKITHFFAAAGTGGTVSGVGKYLKKKNRNIKVIAIDSVTSFYSTHGHPKPYKTEGIDFDTPCLDCKVIDEIISVTDKNALQMLKIMSREYGLLIGPASGAVISAMKKYTKKLKKGDVAVMIFGDSGKNYLSKNYYF